MGLCVRAGANLGLVSKCLCRSRYLLSWSSWRHEITIRRVGGRVSIYGQMQVAHNVVVTTVEYGARWSLLWQWILRAAEARWVTANRNEERRKEQSPWPHLPHSCRRA
jgi:hypothetical protein